MNDVITDLQLSFMLKAALEYNASLIALCINYHGTLADEKNRKRFINNYRALDNSYQQTLHEIFPRVEAS